MILTLTLTSCLHRPALFNSDDIVSLVVVCSRLALDPTAAPIRNAIETTLKTLLRTLELSDSSTVGPCCRCLTTRCSLCCLSAPALQALRGSCRRSSPIQTSVPARTPARAPSIEQILQGASQVARLELPRRPFFRCCCCCYSGAALLPPCHKELVTHSLSHLQDIFNGPPPLSTFQALLETHGDGPFKIVAGMDDSALYYHALTLTIALTDLTDELYAEGGKGKEARLSVDRIAKALAMVEGRIRESCSACQRSVSLTQFPLGRL